MTQTELQRRVVGEASTLTIAAFLGIAVSFIGAAVTFANLLAADKPRLTGADAQLGFPAQAISLTFFAIVAAVGVARLSGARFERWFDIGFVVVTIVGTAFQLWAVIAVFSAPALALLVFALVAVWLAIVQARRPTSEAQVARGERTLALGIVLILAGIAGWIGAFALTVDKAITIVSPSEVLSCNFSVLVQCGVNLKSWQGSVFGFPNPLLGLGGFVAPIVIGIAILAGARFSRALWLSFNLGVAGALALVIWLIYQSIFVLTTLCPWCMLVWSATIPLFWLVTLYNLKSGNIPISSGARRFFAGAYSYVPFITVASYLVVAVLAQVQLDAIHRLG
jgi:uncharacterized membrane protein